jgi:hypothetical protein
MDGFGYNGEAWMCRAIGKDETMNKRLMSLYLAFALLVTPCLAMADNPLVEIDLEQVPLKSVKLRKEFEGYSFTVQNNSPKPVSLLNAQVKNGVDGSAAYSSVDNGSGVGIWWAICGPAGFFTFGTAWLVGLLGTPVYIVVDKNRNKKARIESMPYTNIVDLGTLNNGDSLEVKTLARLGTKPQLKLTLQDEVTKETFMVSR